MLQEVELLIKWLLLKAWETGAAERKGAELLKEKRLHSDPLVEIAGLLGGCPNCCRDSPAPSTLVFLPTSQASSLVMLRICPVLWGSPVEPPSGSEAS